MTSGAPVNLLGMARPQLEGWFSAHGARAFHARQFMKWVYHRDTDDFDAMTDLSRALRSELDGKPREVALQLALAGAVARRTRFL